jgi:hypothetical protein
MKVCDYSAASNNRALLYKLDGVNDSDTFEGVLGTPICNPLADTNTDVTHSPRLKRAHRRRLRIRTPNALVVTPLAISIYNQQAKKKRTL